MSKCTKCGAESRVRIDTGSGQYLELCHECNNEVVAEQVGVENFTDYIRRYRTVDIGGIEHEFEINKEIFVMGIKWIAHEMKNGEYEGYSFELYTEFESDPRESLQKLYDKIHKGLEVRYIEERYCFDQKLYSLINDRLVGRIEYDDTNGGETPKIIVDGKPYSWEELGRMLMGYEGFNLHIKMIEQGLDEEELTQVK